MTFKAQGPNNFTGYAMTNNYRILLSNLAWENKESHFRIAEKIVFGYSEGPLCFPSWWKGNEGQCLWKVWPLGGNTVVGVNTSD